MKTLVPIMARYVPIQKLALLPFDKQPDSVYRVFELQYISGEAYGTGYRVVAYRNDRYVDVYDDASLRYMPDEPFNVTENGLHRHVQTNLGDLQLENRGGNVHIAFRFRDLLGREVDFSVKEHIGKAAKPLQLLAPVGAGSQKPDHLPVYWLYDFHFVRQRKTEVNCSIDGRTIAIDKFIPLGGQRRYFIRYSERCRLIEFAPARYSACLKATTDVSDVYRDGNVTYRFERPNVLKDVTVA